MDDARGVMSNNKLVGELHPVGRMIQASSPDENLKLNISQGQIGGGRDTTSGTLKSETVSKKSFALQDKVSFFFLICIYIKKLMNMLKLYN